MSAASDKKLDPKLVDAINTDIANVWRRWRREHGWFARMLKPWVYHGPTAVYAVVILPEEVDLIEDLTINGNELAEDYVISRVQTRDDIVMDDLLEALESVKIHEAGRNGDIFRIGNLMAFTAHDERTREDFGVVVYHVEINRHPDSVSPNGHH